MAAQRDSVNKAGKALCELVFEGGTITPAHIEAANRLMRFVEAGGSYSKQYDSHEERVLNRHLNLYRNKLSKAVTSAQRLHWQSKIAEQEAKIRKHKVWAKGIAAPVAESQIETDDLDLDGL